MDSTAFAVVQFHDFTISISSPNLPESPASQLSKAALFTKMK
jgi:hypothetical protein